MSNRTTLITISACTLDDLCKQLNNLKYFVLIASRCNCKATPESTNVVCGDNAGISAQLIERTLTDGSHVYDLEFGPLDVRVPQARLI